MNRQTVTPVVPITLAQLKAMGFDFTWKSFGFPSMAEAVAERASLDGTVRVEHFDMTEFDAANLAIEVLTRGDQRRYTPPGIYARLMVKLSEDDPDYQGDNAGWCIMMSDSRAERLETARLLEVGRGDVLVAGLGLGMLVHGLAVKSVVTSITVIEKSAAVIECVAPSLARYGERVQVIQADARTWAPADPGKGYDTVLLDIWPYIGETMRDELVSMRAHYERACPGAYIEGWLEREVILSEDLWDRVIAECKRTENSGVKVDLDRALGMFLGRWKDTLAEAHAKRSGQ